MRGAARRAACATGGPGPGRRPRDAASASVQVRISLAGSVSPPSSPARPAPFGRPFYPLGPFTESLPRKWVETRQLSGRMRRGCTMGRRMLRTLMGTFSHPAVLACLLIAATLVLLPAMGSSSPSLREQSVEDLLPPGLYPSLEDAHDSIEGNLDSMRAAASRGELTLAQTRLMAAEAERLDVLDEALAATGLRGFLSAAARYYELVPSCAFEGQALQFRALSELDDPAFYTRPAEIPAAIYLTAQQFYVAPVALSAHTLTPGGDVLAEGYDGSLDCMVWTIPLFVAALVGARVGGGSSRRFTAPHERIAARVVSGALCGVAAVAVVAAPAFVITCLRCGIGDLAYPVVMRAADDAYAVSTVGAVLAGRIGLFAVLSLAVASVAAASCELAGRLAPAVCACGVAVACAAQPWYFSMFGPLWGVAHMLPATYLDIERLTGAVTPLVATATPLLPPGVDGASGVVTLAATAACAAAMALVARSVAAYVERWQAWVRRGHAYRTDLAARVWSRLVENNAYGCSPLLPGDPLAHGPPCSHRNAPHDIDDPHSCPHGLPAWPRALAYMPAACRLLPELQTLTPLNVIGLPPPDGIRRWVG